MLFLLQYSFFVGQEKFAQILDNPCGTFSKEKRAEYSEAMMRSASFSINNTKYIFNVKVHYIANNVPVNEQEIKAIDIVGVMNLNFNQAEIYFKYAGFDNIVNTSYLQITSANVGDLYATNTGFIDIYVVDLIENDPNTLGVCYDWSTPTGAVRKAIAIRKDKLPNYTNVAPTNNELGWNTLAHEVGHYFGLDHTHQRWKITPNPSNPNEPVRQAIRDTDSWGDCSVVDENVNGTEWAQKGDLVQDTNPDKVYGMYKNNSDPYKFYSPPTCLIYQNGWLPTTVAGCLGNTVNFNAAVGAVFNPNLNNIMGYYQQCSQTFTLGQYNRMRTYIDTNIVSVYQFLANKQNTINSLYQPFFKRGGTQPSSPSGNSTTAYMRTITPNEEETGVNVWNCPQYYLRYQKGFNTNFSTFYGLQNKTGNIQFNHVNSNGSLGLQIPIIDPVNIVGVDGINWDCFASFEPYTKGKILSTSTLGSYNLAQQVLSPTQASDPNLIDNLEVQKYHVITKETDAGFQIHKTIYKTP